MALNDNDDLETFAEISGTAHIAIATGVVCALHFKLRSEWQADLDCIVYPPSAFRFDKRTEQAYWLGDRRLAVKTPPPKELQRLHQEQYA